MVIPPNTGKSDQKSRSRVIRPENQLSYSLRTAPPVLRRGLLAGRGRAAVAADPSLPSFDLCLDTILSQSSGGSSFDLMGTFPLRYALSHTLYTGLPCFKASADAAAERGYVQQSISLMWEGQGSLHGTLTAQRWQHSEVLSTWQEPVLDETSSSPCLCRVWLGHSLTGKKV